MAAPGQGTFGIDRYGRPQGYGQTSPYTQQPTSNPQQNQNTPAATGQRMQYPEQNQNTGSQPGQPQLINSTMSPSPSASPNPQATGQPGQSPGAAPHYSAPDAYQPQNVNYQSQSYSPYQFNWSQPAQSYQAGTISQYQAPDQSAQNSQMNGLISQLLSSGGSMGPAWLAGQQETAKENILSQQQQQQQAMGSQYAARGIAGGGQQMADQNRLNSSTLGQLTSANNQLAGQAATQNYSDQLNALGVGDSLANSQMNRSTQGYGAQYQGQMGQQSLNQAQAQSQLALMGQLDNRQQMQMGDHQFGANYGMQNAQNMANYGMQNQQMQMQGGQNQLANLLAQFQQNEGVRQFNAGQNNQFAQGANNNQSALIAQLLGLSG